MTCNTEEVIAKVKEKAKGNFRAGLNCAESVFEAFISVVDVELPHQTMCLMTGFGAGGGLFGDTCGALVGAMAALGTVYGRRDFPADLKASQEESTANPASIASSTGCPTNSSSASAAPNAAT